MQKVLQKTLNEVESETDENSVEMKKMTDLGIMHDIILLNDKNIKMVLRDFSLKIALKQSFDIDKCAKWQPFI